MQGLSAARVVNTGDGALDALIMRLADQVIGSVGGMGRTLAALQLAELLAAERPPGRRAGPRRQAYATQYEQMYAKPVEKPRRSLAVDATSAPLSQRSLRWARIRELGEAIMAGDDDLAQLVQQARDLVGVLHGLEEWDPGPAALRPVPMVALNDHQVTLVYSLVLLALVRKTDSTVDRPGEPRYSDMRDRWLACTAEELEEVRARLAEVWGFRLGDGSGFPSE